VRTRLALGAGGVVLGLFGTYHLLSLGLHNLLDTVIWLTAGVLLHDGILAFATIAVVGVGALLLPGRLKAPLAAAFLVLGTVTLTAVPVLGRFGARADNPTLLDRNYLVGWLVFVTMVGVATAAAVVRGGRRGRRGAPRTSGD
jgi:hypothetical protein